MAQIFISYVHDDLKIVEALARSLQDRGHNAVYAGASLTPGVEWRTALQNQLSSSDLTIALVTSRSLESQFVIAEASAAMAYSHQSEGVGMIPVVLDGAELPPVLREVQAISGSSEDMDEVALRIDNALSRMLGLQVAKEQKREKERDRIEQTATAFVSKSRSDLERRENQDRRLGHIWYGTAYAALMLGIAASAWRAFAIEEQSGDWHGVAELLVSGIVLVALILAAAKFSFTLGKSFMVEAIRSADRSHAIAFGEFYMNAVGETPEWGELKEAFQHWNIDRGSSFLSQDSKQFDPMLLETAVKIVELLRGRAGDEA